MPHVYNKHGKARTKDPCEEAFHQTFIETPGLQLFYCPPCRQNTDTSSGSSTHARTFRQLILAERRHWLTPDSGTLRRAAASVALHGPPCPSG